MSEYSELSKDITKKLTKLEKKEDGIFFTPPTIIKLIISILAKYIGNGYNILEPSCGSCEFIIHIKDKIKKNIKITGLEYNKKIYNSIKEKIIYDDVDLRNHDFIKYTTNMKYDLILGNPPYYVMKKSDVDEKYMKYFDGRPNIFILFILKSIELLSENGIISFVLPKNFLNCLYYNKTRQFINDNFIIIDIIWCSKDKYIETEQETIIFIIKKKNSNINNAINNDKYVLNIKKNNNYIIFQEIDNLKKIKKLYLGSKTLHELGFCVKVGNIVWNQVKNILTSDNKKTRLIYSSDIVNNKLTIKKYKNDKKLNYIDKDGKTDLLLVINRGYGTGEYKFNYCLIDVKFKYLIENHLICIEPITNINRDELIKKYKTIIKSLNDIRTKEFIKIYFGNNAINTTELNHIIPFYN